MIEIGTAHLEIKEVLHTPILLTPHSKRRMELAEDLATSLYTNEGVLSITGYKGYISDGRSGGWLIDRILPHWGNEAYALAVLIHDFLFSSNLVSQELANEIFIELLKRAGIGKFRRKLALMAVSSLIGDDAYGTQDKFDKLNLGKVTVRWDAK